MQSVAQAYKFFAVLLVSPSLMPSATSFVQTEVPERLARADASMRQLT
jgi:hypothetical protein